MDRLQTAQGGVSPDAGHPSTWPGSGATDLDSSEPSLGPGRQGDGEDETAMATQSPTITVDSDSEFAVRMRTDDSVAIGLPTDFESGIRSSEEPKFSSPASATAPIGGRVDKRPQDRTAAHRDRVSGRESGRSGAASRRTKGNSASPSATRTRSPARRTRHKSGESKALGRGEPRGRRGRGGKRKQRRSLDDGAEGQSASHLPPRAPGMAKSRSDHLHGEGPVGRGRAAEPLKPLEASSTDDASRSRSASAASSGGGLEVTPLMEQYLRNHPRGEALLHQLERHNSRQSMSGAPQGTAASESKRSSPDEAFTAHGANTPPLPTVGSAHSHEAGNTLVTTAGRPPHSTDALPALNTRSRHTSSGGTAVLSSTSPPCVVTTGQPPSHEAGGTFGMFASSPLSKSTSLPVIGPHGMPRRSLKHKPSARVLEEQAALQVAQSPPNYLNLHRVHSIYATSAPKRRQQLSESSSSGAKRKPAARSSNSSSSSMVGAKSPSASRGSKRAGGRDMTDARSVTSTASAASDVTENLDQPSVQITGPPPGMGADARPAMSSEVSEMWSAALPSEVAAMIAAAERKAGHGGTAAVAQSST